MISCKHKCKHKHSIHNITQNKRIIIIIIIIVRPAVDINTTINNMTKAAINRSAGRFKTECMRPVNNSIAVQYRVAAAHTQVTYL